MADKSVYTPVDPAGAAYYGDGRQFTDCWTYPREKIDEMVGTSLDGIETAKQDAIAAVQEAGSDAVQEIEAKGEETLESIPDDYTQLSEDVSELKSDFTQLENDVNDIKSQVFTYTENAVYSIQEHTKYTSSTFSGWITDFVATKDMNVESFLIPIKARANAITKVRLFYGTGSYLSASTEYVDMDVNIPSNTQKTIEFKKKVTLSEGDYFFVGYACNQFCDCIYAGSNSYGGSGYTTGGSMPSNSKYGNYNAYVDTVKIAVYYIEKFDVIPLSSIPDISQDKLSFSEHKIPTNLYDYTSEVMNKKGYWYYETTDGNIVSPTSNQYTTNYTAITLPIYNAEKIYLAEIPDAQGAYFYWCGFCDANMKLLSHYSPGNVTTYNMNVPSGAVYFVASFNSTGSALSQIIVSASEVDSYSEYFAPYYLLKGCKMEDGSDAEQIVSLKLPAKYDLVVGDTFQLFYKGIVNAVNDDDFYIFVDCSKGKTFKRLYEFTPTTSGDTTAYVYLYDSMMNLVDNQPLTLSVHAKPSSPVSEKNVLCVGDSLTVGGTWCKEFYRRLTGTGGTPVGDELTNISFIGTLDNDGVGYEGYGGWKFTSYNTDYTSDNAKIITCAHDKTSADQHSIYKDANNAQWKLETIESGQIKIIAVSGSYGSFPSTGTLTWVSGGENHTSITYTASQNAPGNPFWNSTANKVDFEWYAENLGVSSIDYVFVLLGWNDAGTSEATYKQNAQTFITNVHTSFPDAKIVLMGLEIPARDGLGNNYGATGIYSRYFDLMKYVHDLDSWYDDLVEDNSNVYHINISGQFDTEYNMQTSTRQVNTRNTTTETYQSNGVHPATTGQMQIADSAYRAFTGIQ